MITKKQILCLIALAIITVIVSVACSDSPTDVGNMAVTEAGPTPTPEFPDDNTNNKLSIDTNQGLIQFKDLSFKSGAYYSIYDTTKKMYFYADVRVDENSKPYVRVITRDENGIVVEDEGKFYDNANGTGAVYNLEATRYQSNNRNTATVTFTEEGYLRIKFSNYGADITYSLTDKKAEEEISKDGLIPEIWWGTYDLVFSDVNNVETTAEVTSDSVKWYYRWLLADYIGNNKWRLDNQYDGYVEFIRNEKGQRILISDERGSGNKERYNMVYVHSEDKDK